MADPVSIVKKDRDRDPTFVCKLQNPCEYFRVFRSLYWESQIPRWELYL